jgi:pimeloyl-ACP methyl ester carboxylesterase
MADQVVTEYQEAEEALFTHYGLSARSHFLDLPDPAVRARVIEAGQGPPLLMVHGGGGIAAQWAPLMAHLTGRRILAVDRPGHGLSGPFHYRGSDFRAHAVSFLAGVLDALDLDQAPVVANSMGGLWTLWLALRRPERVSSMALLGCPALLLNTTAPLPLRLLGARGLNSLLWSLQKPSVKATKGIHEMMGHDPAALERLPHEFWQTTFRSGLLPHFEEAWLTLLERVVGPFGARRGLPLREDDLRKVPHRTLFVWGESDTFGTPSTGERAVEVMPQATLRVVPGGHLPWLDDPAGVGETVQSWLSEPKGAESTAVPGP